MNAATLFGLNFLSYLIVFVLIAALVVIACKVGIAWRKRKDAKVQTTEASEVAKEAEV